MNFLNVLQEGCRLLLYFFFGCFFLIFLSFFLALVLLNLVVILTFIIKLFLNLSLFLSKCHVAFLSEFLLNLILPLSVFSYIFKSDWLTFQMITKHSTFFVWYFFFLLLKIFLKYQVFWFLCRLDFFNILLSNPFSILYKVLSVIIVLLYTFFCFLSANCGFYL